MERIQQLFELLLSHYSQRSYGSMDEKQTIDFIKNRRHYNNFDKFMKNTINRQKLFHEMLNIPYKLNYNILTKLKIKIG